MKYDTNKWRRVGGTDDAPTLVARRNEEIGRAGVASVARGVRDGLLLSVFAYGLWRLTREVK